MTESLLQKLEEKMMVVLSEVEALRREIQRLHQDNVTLRFEKESNLNRVQDLISLLDSVTVSETPAPRVNLAPVQSIGQAIAQQPVLVQE